MSWTSDFRWDRSGRETTVVKYLRAASSAMQSRAGSTDTSLTSLLIDRLTRLSRGNNRTFNPTSGHSISTEALMSIVGTRDPRSLAMVSRIFRKRLFDVKSAVLASMLLPCSRYRCVKECVRAYRCSVWTLYCIMASVEGSTSGLRRRCTNHFCSGSACVSLSTLSLGLTGA
jgi:hypothetical protein